MPKITVQTLGRLLQERRGSSGVRKTAEEIGISPSTLSRIENGKLPDLDTFSKVCRWLKVDPADVLGFSRSTSPQKARAHFRADNTQKPETANALAKLILSAQRALEEQDKGRK